MLSRNHPEIDEWLALRQGPVRPRPSAGPRSPANAARPAAAPRPLRGGLGGGGRRRRAGPSGSPAALSRSRSRAARRSSRRTRSRGSCARGSARTRRSSRTTLIESLDAFRAPLSALATAELCLVIGDHPVVERAPVVDLWLRRRAVPAPRSSPSIRPARSPCRPARPPGCAPSWPAIRRPMTLGELDRRLRETARVALVWSEDDPTGGLHLAALAAGARPRRGLRRLLASEHAERPRCRAGVAPGRRGSWVRTRPRATELGALIVSGDEALRDPRVVGLADRARFVLSTSMFMTEVTGQSHVVLPGTGYLERDGTTVNLEGRHQRQRRAVSAARAGRARVLRPARAALRCRREPVAVRSATSRRRCRRAMRRAGAVRPGPEPCERNGERAAALALPVAVLGRGASSACRSSSSSARRPSSSSRSQTRASGASGTETVFASGSNGTARELTVKVNRRLLAGVVRIAEEHAQGLDETVEVVRAG